MFGNRAPGGGRRDLIRVGGASPMEFVPGLVVLKPLGVFDLFFEVL
jgi:hypothetical protein